ncbi:MAG TPA: hypothetical protein PLP80_15160 [Niabella sp.]|nr:hypothetical protein [Niabella sp.]
MQLQWNDIAAVRGYFLNGMTPEQIEKYTYYNIEEILFVKREMEKEFV